VNNSPTGTVVYAGTQVVAKLNGNTITAGTGVLTLAAGKTLTANNTLTLAGTDATTQTFPTTSATIARTDAAQTFTGDQTLATGNLVIGTDGKGIDFSATSGTGTSELLADYEEGTFTPTFSCDTGTVTVDTATRTATYTKVGRQVTVNVYMVVDSVSLPTGSLYVDGLPFASASNSSVALYANGFAVGATATIMGTLIATLNFLIFRKYLAGSTTAGVAPDTQASSSLKFFCTYFV
jgi:hypothetical protein